MSDRRRSTIRDLRVAIDCLPQTTRIAMLEGIRSNEIVVGAYSNENGICPMLAAHRAGGRTSLVSFARAWDRLAFRDTHVRKARRATARELLILITHLEASLLADQDPAPDLAAARAEHQELISRRPAPSELPDRSRELPDRSRELRRREAWSWMRVLRHSQDRERAARR